MKEIIRKNIKFISIMAVVIVLGIIGSAYAVRTSRFESIAVNTKAATIAAHITYDNTNDNEVVSTNKMLPIEDSLVTYNSTDDRIVKSKFYVSGESSNPDNTIYDISLRDIVMSCELRSEDIKWKLFKGSTEISSGNFSPTFDAMTDQRLVLTTNQNDLTTTSDEYTFMMWISESCTGNIETCSIDNDESKYFNKTITANLKVETSTGRKKALVRKTAAAGSCSYDIVSVPTCNTLTYTGESQTLINDGEHYTLTNNTGIDASTYAVTAKLEDGYKWPDNTTDDKIINCRINRKNASVIANDQTISVSNGFTNDVSEVTTSNFVENDTLTSISLYLDNSNNTIVPSAAVISKNTRSSNDVTGNYNINYINGNAIYKDTPQILITLDDVITYGTNYTYEYEIDDDIPVTCSTSNSSIATCMVNNDGTITIVPTGLGEVTIILTTAETEEYNPSSFRHKINVVCSRSAISPTFSNKTYNGNIQSGIGLNGSNITLGGTVTATNAGSYTATGTPNNGYCWSDGTNNTKNYQWQITKAQGSCTISSVPALTYPTSPTGTIQYSCIGDGDISVTSSSESVIDEPSNVTSTSATLTAVATGTSNITVSISQGSNYTEGASAPRQITVSNAQYIVSYDANGGSNAPDPQIKIRGTALTLTSNIPTWEGHTFVKWNTKADGSGTNYEPGGSYTANASVTLYAQWTASTVTVTYDDNRFWADNRTANGVTTSFDSSTHNMTLNGTQTASNFVQIYPHTFTADDVYRTTLTYVSGSFTKNDNYCLVTEPKKDINFTALSTRNYKCSYFPTSGSASYDLTISSVGASEGKALYNYIWVNSSGAITYNNYVVHVDVSKVSSKDVTYGSTYGTLETPTRTGFTFNGWYTAETGGTAVSSTTSVTNASDHSIYAHWTPKTFTVNYNCNGGTGSVSSQTATFTQSFAVATGGCTRTGYDFAGWTTKSDGTDDGYNWTNWTGTWKYDNGQYGISSNTLNFKARWTAKVTTVTLNKNGGTANGTASVKATYNSSTLNPSSITLPQRKYTISYNANGTGITMPSSSTVSYTLNGWYTAASNGSKVLSNTTSPALQASVSNYTDANKKWIRTSATTLYAQWTSASFTLPSISKTGYTCKWAEGSATGTQYAGGTSRTPTANTTYYAVCTDTTAPTISATYKVGSSTYSGGWTNQNVIATVTFSDNGSGINPATLAWKVAGGDWHVNTSNTNTSSITDTWSAERNSTAYYKICDNAGNCKETSGQAIKIDKTAPSAPTTMEYVYGDWTRYTRGTLATGKVYAAYSQSQHAPTGAKDESGTVNSGIAKYQISTNNSTWTDYSYSSSNSLYYLTTDGTRYYRAVDSAGNASSSISRVATFTETINARRFTQKDYSGTNRVAVYSVTTCTASQCTYTKLNGLAKSVIDANPSYNREPFSSPITKSSLKTASQLNTSYKYTWYVTATDGLYCRTGADANSSNGSTIVTGYSHCTALQIYRTTTTRNTSGTTNWVWYPTAECYLAGDWLDTYANSGCGSSSGGGSGDSGEQCYYTSQSSCESGLAAGCYCKYRNKCWRRQCDIQ